MIDLRPVEDPAMRLTVLAFAAAAALPGAAAAQDCDRADESQTGMNICAATDYRAADAELNQTYDKILKRLGADDATKKRLKEAQRAWIAFRDAECDFATSGSRDGSIYPMIQAQCLEGLTSARSEQLSGYLDARRAT